jgi:peptidoglycan hydrolase CwlO-like protein
MKKTIYFAFMLTISASTFAQSNHVKQPELDSGTIEGQFDYIIEKSTKFRDFQLIRKPSILKVKANTLDSIKTIRKDLVIANSSIEQNKTTISQLQNEVEGLKNEVTSISKDVDSISFMGMNLSKANYNMIVWSLIIILLLGLIVFISLFKKGNIDTTKTQSNLEKLESDFEVFRKKAMLKEQEVMRKLQDELNRNAN